MYLTQKYLCWTKSIEILEWEIIWVHLAVEKNNVHNFDYYFKLK